MTHFYQCLTKSLLFSCFLILGCTQKPPSVVSENPAVKIDTSDSKHEQPKVDLSVPSLPPKPLIWIEDWKGEAELPQERVNAEAVARMADSMKSRRNYSNAARSYRTAIATDPTWPYPVYQAACNFELWGKHEEAVAEFNKAIELGFNDFPTLAGDDELGKIRERPEFTAQLEKVRERYLRGAGNLVGQPIAVRPKGTQPASGWPVMLLLHGFGDSNLSYLEQAEKWAQEGFLTVAVPGSVPAGDGRYQWAHESAKTTHSDLQSILNSPLLKMIIDLKQVYLLGFSQGALHSMVLTSEHPEIYAGVVALSPGGSFSDQLLTPKLNPTQRPAKLYFTHGDQEPHAALVTV